MGAENKYLKKHIPALFRASLWDITIYVFIDAQRFTIPSISIEESAKAFMTYYEVSEDEYALRSVVKSYERTRQKLIDEQKTCNKKA